MMQERGEAPTEPRFLRRREWAYALWTLASIGYGVYAHFTVLDPSDCPSPGSREVVCRAAAEGALGWAYVGLFLIWLFGLGAIWLLAWLIGDELPHRREMRTIDRERADEPRRF